MSKGKPEMFNTDRGSQFTSPASTGALLALGIQVSPDEYGTFGMDGNGRYLDNIFVERLWRSIKYEEVYLKAYKDWTEAKQGIGAYLDFYNRERPHQTLGYWAPEKMFHDGQPRKRPEGQQEILIPGVETKPLAAEDSLNLAPLLFR